MWFEQIKRGTGGDDEHILFCFPYAAGNAEVFVPFSHYVNSNTSVYAMQLPGNGRRFSEALCNDVYKILDEVEREATSLMSGKPYSFLGHSNGGLFAFELASRFIAQDKPPARIFIAAEAPPHITDFKHDPMHSDDDEMAEVLRRYGGTQPDILDDVDFRSLFFPIIRNELSINFHMKRALKEKTINYPLVLIHGSRDSTVSKTDIAAWARYTSAHIGLHTVSSDHFFINHQPKEVADIVNQQLA